MHSGNKLPVIGVFDSGIGGLTVVKALLNRLPQHPIIYLGDTARTPYGSKSAPTIINYSIKNSEFLLRQGADLIVVACNTASSYAPEVLRDRFKIPVFEVISPGAELAARRSRCKRIGVIGTRATIASGIYQEKVLQYLPDARVYAAPCPLLVPLVEEGWLQRCETGRIVKKYLYPLKQQQIDTLILGCTHYPVLKPLIQRKIGRRVDLVDSAEAIALQIGAFLNVQGAQPPTPGTGNLKAIFVTDTADHFRRVANRILQTQISIEQADL